jgi:predicted nucleic acid-binding protein
MKDNRILIDTSVWIDYLKQAQGPLHDKVDEILEGVEIYVPKIVIAELIQGAKSEKEIAVIEEFTSAFTIVDQTENTWHNAGMLSFSLKRKGITVGLVDCYIAVLAIENKCAIYTLDDHFKGIAKVSDLKLYP